MTKIFRKNSKYEVYWKSVRWSRPSQCRQTDGGGGGDMTKVTVALRVCFTNTRNCRTWSPVRASPQTMMRNRHAKFQSTGGPCWEANKRAIVRDILYILWNSIVHCLIQKSHLVVFILSQMNQVHILTSCFFKMHCNVILLPAPKSSKSSFRFFHQNSI